MDDIGRDWLIEQVDGWIEKIKHVKPSDFNEEHRYLPKSVTSLSGPFRMSITPYMVEPLNCMDVNSPIREVNFKKGSQVGYTTGLIECALLYFAAHVSTLPIMLVTADKELAEARVETSILPMLQQSGFADIIQAADVSDKRKTGKTKNLIQFKGGSYLVPSGILNPRKARQYSICVMFKDEIDGWPDVVGVKGEDPETITDARCKGYWTRRKIMRGSTPLIKGMSKIDKAYLRGDQRKYLVLCVSCGFPQELRWSGRNKETDKDFGFKWELEKGTLLLDSVRYSCANCQHDHYEADKDRLFALDQGAHWEPTSRPVEPFIRSYQLPSFYSPAGMHPWSQCVAMYLSAFDPIERKVIDIGRYQTFYNHVLGESFEVMGSKIHFATVSGHRRRQYRLGEVPNKFAEESTGGHILLLTCQVDVHKDNLAVAIMGWTRDMRCFLVDYWRLEDPSKAGCEELSSSAWIRLKEIIEETTYTADNGIQYGVTITLIDAGYANSTVCEFCEEYSSGVYPVLGREKPAKNQRIQEFAKFKTQIGTVGFRILVDHYKDRLAPVLRREWAPDAGEQKRYHFNAPVDTSDRQLEELTKEIRREKKDDRGNISYYWHRPSGAPNELWDLLVYGHAAVEILAWEICVGHFELEEIDWPQFWDFIESQELYFHKA